MEAFDKVIADVRITKLGLDVSLKLAEKAIPLGVQFQNAGEAGQRYDTWCRRCHELLFAGHIGTGNWWSSQISGRAGDIARPLVIAALLMAITTIAPALAMSLVVVTSLAAALTALALVAMTVALALSLAAVVSAIIAVAVALASVISLTLAALALTMALAMTISAALPLTLLALALSASSVMATPAASLAWGVTIRPFGMVCWPHVFRPVV